MKSISKLLSDNVKILFLYRHNRSFVNQDYRLLIRRFIVKKLYVKGFNIFKLPFYILNYDVIFIWFASVHAFVAVLFSRLFKKKVIVVTGGFDVAKTFTYGLLRSSLFTLMVRYILKNADKVLAVSDFNKDEIIKNLGIYNVFVVHNGVNTNYFTPDGKKENMVLTVAYITKNNIRRKGLVSFIKTAFFLPDVKFVVVGKSLDKESFDFLKEQASDNVVFTGYVPDLLSYYRKAKVYCQFSEYESFGLSLAEAMSCECVPVVTDKGALPEVVGETGFYVKGDVDSIAKVVKKALKSNGKNARKRIIKLFDVKKREKKLTKVVLEMMKYG